MQETLQFLRYNGIINVNFYEMTEQEQERLFWDTDFEPIAEITHEGYFEYCKEGESDRIEGIENMEDVQCEYLGHEKYMI